MKWTFIGRMTELSCKRGQWWKYSISAKIRNGKNLCANKAPGGTNNVFYKKTAEVFVKWHLISSVFCQKNCKTTGTIWKYFYQSLKKFLLALLGCQDFLPCLTLALKITFNDIIQKSKSIKHFWTVQPSLLNNI